MMLALFTVAGEARRRLTRHYHHYPYLILVMLVSVWPGALAPAQTVIPVGAFFEDGQVLGAVEESPGDGTCSLREAIHNANLDADVSRGDCPAGSGTDTITLIEYVAYTLYDAPYDADGPNGLPSITSPVMILSQLDVRVAAGTDVVIARAPGAPVFRLFHVGPGGSLHLSGLTLKNGWSSGGTAAEEGHGGAVYVAPGGSLKITDGLVTENRSDNAGFQDDGGNGGGIYVASGASLAMLGTTVSLNMSDNGGIAGAGGSGGGVYLGRGASLLMRASTVKYNASRGRGTLLSNGGSGGGIYADAGAALTIEDSEITSNAVYGGDVFGPGASGYGGGLYLGADASVVMRNTTLSRNVTDSGGDACFGAYRGGDGGGLYAGVRAVIDIQDSRLEANRTGDGVRQIGRCPGSDGGDGGGVFADSNATVSLQRTVVSGNATGHGSPETAPEYGAGAGGAGGGLFTGPGATLTVRSSVLARNSTGNGAQGAYGGSGGFGGGLYAAGGTVLIEANTVIEGNATGSGASGSGGSGGGLYVGPEGTLTLTACTVRGNATGHGGADLGGGLPGGSGGGLVAGSEATISGCMITENRTGKGGADRYSQLYLGGDGGAGGGIAGQRITLTASTVSLNHTGAGGDIESDDPYAASGSGGSGGGIAATALTLLHSTISGNTTGRAGMIGAEDRAGRDGLGGGLIADTLTAVSSTIAANTSAGPGGGVAVSMTGTLQNTLVAGNAAPEATGCFNPGGGLTSLGFNLVPAGAGCPATDVDHAVEPAASLDALLLPLADNGGPTPTHALPPGSPAIDRGSCGAGTDQRGEMRPAGDACDVGAFELQAAPPAAALVAYWPLDDGEGTFTADASGGGHDGTLVGDPSWAPGRVGSALALDGQDDYVEVGASPALDLSDALTLSGWFKPGATTGNATGVEKQGAYRLLVKREQQARWMFDLWDAQGGFHRIAATTPVPYDTWHHVAATFDGREMKLYLDGRLDTAATVPGSMRRQESVFQIGRRDQHSYFAGQIDDVYLHNKALGADEILALLGGLVAHSTVATATEAETLPETFALEGNYPNPFNPSTTIAFTLPDVAPVRLELFDVLGRRIATLVASELAAGHHEVAWDGRDAAGHLVPSGTYLYRLEAGAFSQTRTMVMLK